VDEMLVEKPKVRDEWEIRQDFETLQRARAILQDDKRLEEVKKLIKDQKEALDELGDDDFFKKIGLGE